MTSNLEDINHPLLPTQPEHAGSSRSLAELIRQREVILAQMRALDVEIRKLESHTWLLN